MHESNANVEAHGESKVGNLVNSGNVSRERGILEGSSNSTYPGESSSNAQGRLVVCLVHELRQHPSYMRHHLTVSPSQLSAVAAHGVFAFQQPLVITRNRWIIDGHARLELAKRLRRESVLCIEYDLTDEEALRWLIQSHRQSRGRSPYIRILLALDLEPPLQEKARANKQAGGRNKGSSNLTEAESLDVRSEIAAVAGVSTGNVTKVKQLRRTAHTTVEQALRAGEISIHKAWQWSKGSPKVQLENVRRWRIERGLRRRAKRLVAEHQAAILPSGPEPISLNLPEVVSLVKSLSTMSIGEWSEFGTVDLATLDIPGKGIYLTKELVQAFRP